VGGGNDKKKRSSSRRSIKNEYIFISKYALRIGNKKNEKYILLKILLSSRYYLKNQEMRSLILILLLAVLIEAVVDENNCKGNVMIAAASGYNTRDVRTFVLSYNISKTAENSNLIVLLKEEKVKVKKEYILLLEFLNMHNIGYVFVDSSQVIFL
jgi:endo-1,4-beta-D-glucanase Y